MASPSTDIIRQGVLVTNIPYVTDNGAELQDKLDIHFQDSKKGGGGEVQSIVCRIQGDIGKAIVIFKSEQDVKNVVAHVVHTFCDAGELQVQPLPQVFSVLQVDIEEYYWKVLKVPDVQRIGKLFPENGKNLSNGGNDFEQLKDLTLELLTCGPVGESVKPSVLDHESMMEITSRCLEVSRIPYVTDDKKELDDRLRQYFKDMTGRDLAGLACGVEGDLKTAIVVFRSCEDMQLVMKADFDADKIMFLGERLSLAPLPQVMKIHATFNEFYIGLIPKLRRNKLAEFTNLSIEDKKFKLTGSLFEADRAAKCVLEMVGIKQVKASGDAATGTSTHSTKMLARKDSNQPAQSSHEVDSADDNSSKFSKNENNMDHETEYNKQDQPRSAHFGGNATKKEMSRYPGKAIKEVQNMTDEQQLQVNMINDKKGAFGGINQDEDFVDLSIPNEQSTNQNDPLKEPAGTESATHDQNMVQSFDQSFRDKQNDDDNLQTFPKLERDGKDASDFPEVRKPLAGGHRSKDLSQSYNKTNQSDSFKEKKRTQQEDAKPGSQSANVERDELREGFAQVDKIKFEYIMKTKADVLKDIESRYGVCFRTKTHREKDPSILIVTLERVQGLGKQETSEELTKAVGKFLMLYSVTIPDITVKSLTCSGIKLSKVDKAVKTINRKFGDTIVLQEGNEITFCGKESTIKNAISEFQISAGMSEGKEGTHLEISVDCTVFQFIYEHSSEFKQIQKKYQVTFALRKEPSSPTGYGIYLEPPTVGNQKKKLLDKDVKDAKEDFISLYQNIFPSLRKTPLQLHGLSQDDLRKALATTRKTFPKITLTKPTNDGDFIFCNEVADFDSAIQCFRVACGIQLPARKLKKPETVSSSQATSASQRISEAETRLDPSVFSTNEGLQIIALTEDITRQQVDAIVNAANSSLRHNGGVAKAISTAAGPGLQRECDSITSLGRKIQTSECVDTKGYNLPCRTVIHAVGPMYSSDKNFDHNLKKTFLSVLHYANRTIINVKTIAVPLISSGNYGGPLERCTDALATALFEFSKERKISNLQQVFLINIQDATTRAIQQSLHKMFHRTADKEVKDTTSQPVQGQRIYSTKRGLKIIVDKGDITKIKCDVIVNAANENLGHHRGVAQAISTAAGRRLQQESHQIMAKRGNQPLQIGEVVETDGYNLSCRKVAHVVGPRSSQSPNDAVFYSALKETFLNVLKYTNLKIEAATVALPLISSGVFAGSKVTCSKALFDAVQEFADKEQTLIMKTLLLINIDDEATNAIAEIFDNWFQGNKSFEETASSEKSKFKTPEGLELQIQTDDITNVSTDAIINPTDSVLAHAGMVSKAIKAKAGPQLEQECQKIKRKRNFEYLKPGEVVATSGGNLPCKYVLHTVSPTFKQQDSKYGKQLRETLVACFEKADHIKAKDIALPLIGSGTSGAPTDICISSLVQAITSVSKARKLVYLKRVVVVSTNSGLIGDLKKAFSAGFGDVQTSTTGFADTDKMHKDTQAIHQASKIQESHQQFSPTPNVSSPLLFEAENEFKVIVIQSDITKLKADVLLKSANGQLMPDDEISYLINEQAGAELQKECKMIIRDRKCLKPGEFVTTEGFNLPYQKVVHFVKPESSKWEDTLLKILLHAKTALKATTLAVSTSSLSLDTLQSSGDTLHIDVLVRNIRRFSKLLFIKSVKTISIVCADDRIFSALNKNFTRHFKTISVGNTSSPTSMDTSQAQSSNMTDVSDTKNQPGQTQHIGLSGHVMPSSTMATDSLQQPQCLICRGVTDVKKLECCEHTYCMSCIQVYIATAASCRKCKRLYCVTEEKTLKGKMTYYLDTNITLPNSKTQGAIAIVYEFPSGKQGHNDPKPGFQYKGTSITAYLPYTTDGSDVVRQLRTAFVAGKIFAIKELSDRSFGVSLTDRIPHRLGKVKGEDYPDQKYMMDVKKALRQHISGSTCA